ncbi:MAG TPA: hypothetical protein VMZ27_15600 [Candidatus Saccharimonadales bacterium]|nr:hypothetical protein [Candidatus Saccharimonadales bacterium]
MPIKINLLAEAQAVEELRRKDPVKRAILAGVLLVSGALVFSSTVQFKVMASKSELSALEASWKNIEKNYNTTVEVRRKSMECEEKYAALEQMATNRFLWGNALNAFQKTLEGIDQVQVLHLKTEQIYVVLDEAKAKEARLGNKACSTEKISMVIEALDSSTQLNTHSRYKANISSQPFFQNNLQKTNGVRLLSLSAPQAESGRKNPIVKFSLQCDFTEKLR